MRFRIRVLATRWLCPAVGGCLICVVAQATAAERVAVQEIDRAATVNQAETKALEKQIELEQWNFERVEDLRQRGLASWSEVARQQLLVDVLNQRRAASQKLASFLQQLRQRASGVERSPRGNAQQPILLAMPGSVRLVGWLQPDHLSADLLMTLQAGRHMSAVAEESNIEQVERAREGLTQAQHRLKALLQAPNENRQPPTIKHAGLQLEHAKAQLRLAEIRHQLYLRERRQLEEVVNKRIATPLRWADIQSADIAVNTSNCISSDSHTALQDATARVAVAEAEADGETKAAEIALERSRVCLAAYEQLHAKGHASAEELQEARQHSRDAQQDLVRLRDRQSLLDKASDRLTHQSKLSNADQSSSRRVGATSNGFPCRQPTVDAWSASVLANADVTRHLIDLRRHYCDSVWQRDAIALNLRLLETRLQRLVEASKLRPSADQPTQSTPDLNDALLDGERRELTLLQIDIRYAGAKLLAAEQKINILVLEELRFLHQCAAQHELARQQRQEELNRVRAASTTGAPRLNVQNVSLVPRQFTDRISYLESRDRSSLGQIRRLAFSTAEIQFAEFVDWTPRVRRTARGPVIQSTAPGQPAYGYYWRQSGRPNSLFDCVGVSVAGTTRRPYTQRFQFRSPRYRDTYQNGIRRSCYPARYRLTPDRVPWYLPGSTTNF